MVDEERSQWYFLKEVLHFLGFVYIPFNYKWIVDWPIAHFLGFKIVVVEMMKMLDGL